MPKAPARGPRTRASARFHVGSKVDIRRAKRADMLKKLSEAECADLTVLSITGEDVELLTVTGRRLKTRANVICHAYIRPSLTWQLVDAAAEHYRYSRGAQVLGFVLKSSRGYEWSAHPIGKPSAQGFAASESIAKGFVECITDGY